MKARETDVHQPKSAIASRTAVARQQPKRFTFSQKQLDSLPVPPSGSQRVYYYDLKQAKLFAACSPGGRITFGVQKKIKATGKAERTSIGIYRSTRTGKPEMEIEAARDKAAIIVGDVAKGKNPNDDARAKRDELTVSQLLNQYMTEYAEIECEEKTVVNFRSIIKAHLAEEKLVNRKLSTVEKGEVHRLYLKIRKHSLYSANRTIQLLRAAFNKANELGWWKGENPASGIANTKREEKRERFIDQDEIARFFGALKTETNLTLRDLILCGLFVGARRNNVQSMRWEDVKFKSKVWSIPKTKMHPQGQDVALCSEAIAILQDRRQRADSLDASDPFYRSAYVFPGGGKTGHIVEIKATWKRIVKRAELENLRPHDLRRTLASWMAIGGESLLLIGKVLGHTSAAATQVYARFNLNPQLRAVDDAVRRMMGAGGYALPASTMDVTEKHKESLIVAETTKPSK